MNMSDIRCWNIKKRGNREMKNDVKAFCGFLAFLALGFAGYWAYAATVNPASNVTADSDNTAGTIVLRDDSGNFSANVITVANGSIGTAKLTGQIVLSQLATGSVDSNKILNGSIILADLASGSVDSNKLTSGAVIGSKIASSVVDTSKILTTTDDSGKVLASCGGVALWRIGGNCP